MEITKKYWPKYRIRFILAVFFVALESLSDLFQPKLMSLLVDEGALTGSLALVAKYGLTMLGVAFGGMVCALLRNYLSFRVALGFAADLRLDLFAKIHSLSSTKIDQLDSGSLIVRETNDVAQLQSFVSDLMRMAIKAPVICIGSIFMAASMSSRTLPIIISVVVLVLAFIVTSMLKAYPRFGRMQNALDRLNTMIREYLVGIRLVKAFRRLNDEKKRFDTVNDDLAEETIGANRVLAVFSPFLSLTVNLGIAAILWFGAVWVDYGEMEVGSVMAFVTYMTSILSSVVLISNSLNGFVRARASYVRIAEVFNADAVQENNIAAPAPAVGKVPFLRFEDVGFRYFGATEDDALKHLTFSIQSGEKLGIIGPTGSGKTTLAALLMRFYSPTEGAIFVNGRSLMVMDEKDWRENIGLVPQSPVLFSGSIRSNIIWGLPDATDEEVRRSAADAQALQFIEELDGGFEYVLGQSGGLSGGQKQRISIARALIRRPDLLILDDCTSALDMETEARIRSSLNRYPMTTIYITQRISTARNCDRILVLENGMCAGIGTHKELMTSCPLYQDIYRSQVGGDDNG